MDVESQPAISPYTRIIPCQRPKSADARRPKDKTKRREKETEERDEPLEFYMAEEVMSALMDL